jgi:hypothetical protein
VVASSSCITSFVPERSNKKGARFAKARDTVAFLLALSGSRQTNRLRLLGRYRMARISQSATLYELASWMRPQKSLAKNALPYSPWFVVSERLLQRIDESASIFET